MLGYVVSESNQLLWLSKNSCDAVSLIRTTPDASIAHIKKELFQRNRLDGYKMASGQFIPLKAAALRPQWQEILEVLAGQQEIPA